MTSNELSPYRYFDRVVELWWLVFLVALLGGALGYLFFSLHAPMYEATASYYVRIDLALFPMTSVGDDLLRYNEDMAVNVTKEVLLSGQVLNDVVNQLKTKGIELAPSDLLQSYTIERKLDIWELRVQNHSPAAAQTIVNTWAEIGYQAMVAWQSSGKVENYVVFQPPTQAITPTQPVLYGRNNVMLAGALIGLIVGFIVTNRLSQNPSAAMGA